MKENPHLRKDDRGLGADVALCPTPQEHRKRAVFSQLFKTQVFVYRQIMFYDDNILMVAK
jgi:hypothetical protein